jgi:NitT/TauT family transport system substrate-binding protein
MARSKSLQSIVLLIAIAATPAASFADDTIKVLVPQKGNWETSVPDLGQRKGIFGKYGLKIETLYTSGGGETMQALISGSADIAVATGTAAILSAFAKGAPIRPIAASMTGADDLFWYVPASSPIRSLKDAAGKTMAFSAAGSSSNLATIALIRQAGVDIRPVATGTPAATFVQVMSGQVDIGWTGPPFGIDALQAGKIRIVAIYSDVPAFRNMTVRMHVANLNFLTGRRELADKFLQADAETLDWMYEGSDAIAEFATMAGIPQEQARITRDKFYPRNNLKLARLSGLDDAMKDAVAARFLAQPLRKEEIDELFKYYLRY